MPRAKELAGGWRTLAGASPAELRPAHTLLNGQCFGWRPHELRQHEYVGVLGQRVVAIRQTPTVTQYRALHGDATGLESELVDYFQLATPLQPLYSTWASASCPVRNLHSSFGALSGSFWHVD